MTRASALEQFGHSHQLDEWMYPSGTLVSIWTCEGMPLSLRLIYEGQLLSAQVKSKHDYRRNLQAIRKQLHPQLRDFWRRNHDSISTWGMPTGFGGILAGRVPYGDDEERAKGLEQIAQHYQHCGIKFIPLITKAFKFFCSLDILFLRQEDPGALIQGGKIGEHGGDIDNRLNTLFEGLQLPSGDCGDDWIAEESPFYCLLENDILITHVKVTTDRLLKPMPSKTDVLLMLNVDVMLADNPWW